MNLNEVKVDLGVETLNLFQVVTEAGEKTSWYKDWNNNARIAILIHQNALDTIKANKSISNLGINTQVKQGSKGEYTAHTICIYKEADEVL